MRMKPGYKQSEWGVIPEDWKTRSAGELCRVNQGLQIPISSRLKNPSPTSRLYITIQYLNEGKEAEYIDSYNSAVCCSQEDVLMTRTGNTGMVITDVDGVFHNNFFKINYDKKLLRKKYLIYYLSQDRIRRLILIKAGTSTIPDLNHNDFYSIPIIVPPLSEQEAAADALSDADSLIGSLEQLLIKKRQIKHGAMQELLTGRKRLPGFGGEWEKRRLGEISEIAIGRTPSRLNLNFWGPGFTWLSISDLRGKIVTESKEQITPAAAADMHIIPRGTLLMSFKLSIGRLCFAG